MARVAILVAVPQELAPVVRRLGLKDRRLLCPGLRLAAGEIHAHQVAACAAGMGARRAAAAAGLVIDAWQPDLVVMAGVAGALSADLRVGDVVAAAAVVGPAGLFTPPVVPSGARSGAFLSLDRVLVTAADKAEALAHPACGALSPGEQALAVEMETAGLARAAEERGVRWAAVRGISDTASEELPIDFNRLRAPDGGLPTARVARAALLRPSAIPRLLRLGRSTSAGAEAAAGFLEEWLRTGAGKIQPRTDARIECK